MTPHPDRADHDSDDVPPPDRITEHPGVAVIVEEKAWVHHILEYICTAGEYDDPGFPAGHLTLLHEGSILTRTAGAWSDAAMLARRTAEVLLTPDDRMAG